MRSRILPSRNRASHCPLKKLIAPGRNTCLDVVGLAGAVLVEMGFEEGELVPLGARGRDDLQIAPGSLRQVRLEGCSVFRRALGLGEGPGESAMPAAELQGGPVGGLIGEIAARQGLHGDASAREEASDRGAIVPLAVDDLVDSRQTSASERPGQGRS